MNDFLQSLRNGQAGKKQRVPKTRGSYDHSGRSTRPRFHSYGGYQSTRSQQMKRPAAPQQSGNQMPADDMSTSAMLAKAIEILSNHIETLTRNQDYLVSIQERKADMLERQAVAIERIVDHLNIVPKSEETTDTTDKFKKVVESHYIASKKSQKITQAPVEKAVVRRRKKIVTGKAKTHVFWNAGRLGRDAVMEIIYNMRAEGATFEKIAHHLISLGQPTFSGRGEWHAQTIHRLCNEK